MSDLVVLERVAVEIEAVAGGVTSSSEAAGYRNGLLRAAQIVRAALGRTEAERDAAVAAVERVRAIHMRGETRPGEYFCTYPACESYWPCPTVAALDGAEVGAVRDAALTRIAELEADLEVAMRPHSECERSGAEAGKRIVDLEGDLARAEVRYAGLEQCLRNETLARRVDATLLREYERRFAEAAKLHQCFEAPNGFRWCSGCSTDEYPEDWPCETAIALGLNEGENYDPC